MLLSAPTRHRGRRDARMDARGAKDSVAVSASAVSGSRARKSAARNPAGPRSRFGRWRRQRPFVGGLLVALGGVELFFSGQLDIGKIHVQLGIEGLQATIIPVVMVLVGILAMAMPAHRIFYGVIALALAVYSLVGVNLGGFFVGMLLGAVGGVLVVAWMPAVPAEADVDADAGSGSGRDSARAERAAS